MVAAVELDLADDRDDLVLFVLQSGVDLIVDMADAVLGLDAVHEGAHDPDRGLGEQIFGSRKFILALATTSAVEEDGKIFGHGSRPFPLRARYRARVTVC